MQRLEESIYEMTGALDALPQAGRRRLEESMQQLTAEQIDFVRSALESALLDDHLPTHQLALLEHFFESWWKHSLATKLVVIDRVIELSDGGTWPGEIPLRHAMSDRPGDACAVAAD